MGLFKILTVFRNNDLTILLLTSKTNVVFFSDFTMGNYFLGHCQADHVKVTSEVTSDHTPRYHGTRNFINTTMLDLVPA